MQVGSAHNAALNSLLAASFAETEFASAARAFYISNLARNNKAQMEQRIAETDAARTNRSTEATQELFRTKRVTETAEQVRVYYHQQALTLGDFQRVKVALSAADEAEIFGSDDMVGDDLAGDVAQRRNRFSRSNFFQFLGTANQDNAATTLGAAPQYDLDLSLDGEILELNPRPDFTASKPMEMPLIKDIQTMMGQSIQSKVAALYAANHTIIESQGAFYSMVS